MKPLASYPRSRRHGFSLVELIVVIGIIALLIAILLPSLNEARAQSKRVQCQSNLRQIGQQLLMYSNSWRGYMFPPGLGANSPCWDRWPVHVFKLGKLPTPPVDDTEIYTPKILLCPADPAPIEFHSYLLNDHLADKKIRYFSKDLGGLTSSDIVLMGEKTDNPLYADYYMDRGSIIEPGDYATRVEQYRHGIKHGSNYLFLDLHVGLFKPKDRDDQIKGLDPWDIDVKDKSDEK